jgi:hypothetical protein
MTLALICAGALLAAAPAAAADPAQWHVIGNVGTQPAPVRVIQLDATVTDGDLARLAPAVAGTRVIALVPAGAKLDATEEGLAGLKNSGASSNLDVVVQPGGGENGTAVRALAHLAARSHRLSSAPCDPRCVQDALRALQLSGNETANAAGRTTTVGAAIVAPAPRVAPTPEGGGISLPAAVLAFVLLVLAAVLTGMLVTRLRATPAVATEPEPTAQVRLPPPPPRRGAHAGRAQVVSVLEPEGYVEVDGCLRRAAWAADGPPPHPGDWVELQQRQGRLWAFPPKSRTRSRASA